MPQCPHHLVCLVIVPTYKSTFHIAQKMHTISKRRPTHPRESKPLYSTKHRCIFINLFVFFSHKCVDCTDHATIAHACCDRSLNDKNKILLTSFFMNDIPKLLDQSRTKDKSHNKTARMYADISSFLEGVCRDIKIMYPSTSGDYQYVQRLFTRLMDSPSTGVQSVSDTLMPVQVAEIENSVSSEQL